MCGTCLVRREAGFDATPQVVLHVHGRAHGRGRAGGHELEHEGPGVLRVKGVSKANDVLVLTDSLQHCNLVLELLAARAFLTHQLACKLLASANVSR